MSDILMYDKIGNGGKYNEWLLLKIGDNVLFDTHVHLNDKKYGYRNLMNMRKFYILFRNEKVYVFVHN